MCNSPHNSLCILGGSFLHRPIVLLMDFSSGCTLANGTINRQIPNLACHVPKQSFYRSLGLRPVHYLHFFDYKSEIAGIGQCHVFPSNTIVCSKRSHFVYVW